MQQRNPGVTVSVTRVAFLTVRVRRVVVRRIARYVGKYVSKHIGSRREEDKGVRLIAMSKGVKVGSTAFRWHSVRATFWRMRVRAFAISCGCFNPEQLRKQFGPRWAWIHYERIMNMPIWVYPTAAHARADGVVLPAEIPDDATDIRLNTPEPGPLAHNKSEWCREVQSLRALVLSIFGLEAANIQQGKNEQNATQFELFLSTHFCDTF